MTMARRLEMAASNVGEGPKVEFVGSNYGTAANAISFALGYPAGIQTGDIIILSCHEAYPSDVRSSMSVSGGSTNYTLMHTLYANDTSDINTEVYYATYVSGSSVTCYWLSSSSASCAAHLRVYRGASSVAGVSSGFNNNGVTITWPSASSLSSGDVLVYNGAMADRYTPYWVPPSITDLSEKITTLTIDTYSTYAASAHKEITSETSFTANPWAWTDGYIYQYCANAYSCIKLSV